MKYTPPFSNQCPYCLQNMVVSESNWNQSKHDIQIENDYLIQVVTTAIFCPNPNCEEYQIIAQLYRGKHDHFSSELRNEVEIEHWTLKPQMIQKLIPEYVPKGIADDFREACLILELSPKASAALSRRCLQGMIRDFWNINKNTLKQEIEALEDKVSQDVWEAIDAIRKVGNVGAHMEKDVRLIVEIEPNEANSLIRLMEVLIAEWYVARHERKQRIKEVIQYSNMIDQKRDSSKKGLEEESKG